MQFEKASRMYYVWIGCDSWIGVRHCDISDSKDKIPHTIRMNYKCTEINSEYFAKVYRRLWTISYNGKTLYTNCFDRLLKEYDVEIDLKDRKFNIDETLEIAIIRLDRLFDLHLTESEIDEQTQKILNTLGITVNNIYNDRYNF